MVRCACFFGFLAVGSAAANEQNIADGIARSPTSAREKAGILLQSHGATARALTASTPPACPYATWVYNNGAHCCRTGMDSDGNEITYASTSCWGNHYIDCPGGGVCPNDP